MGRDYLDAPFGWCTEPFADTVLRSNGWDTKSIRCLTPAVYR